MRNRIPKGLDRLARHSSRPTFLDKSHRSHDGDDPFADLWGPPIGQRR